MRVSSEVWAATNSRLEKLLMLLNSDQPATSQTLCVLKGTSLILHLAALCSTTTRYCQKFKKHILYSFVTPVLSLSHVSDLTVLLIFSGCPLRRWAGL